MMCQVRWSTTTNAATEAPLPCDQVINDRNQDVQDQSDTQRANDSVQQTINPVVDAQAWEPDDNVQGTTSPAMDDTLHRDEDLNKRNLDEQDETDPQHADAPMMKQATQLRMPQAPMIRGWNTWNFQKNLNGQMYPQHPHYHRHVPDLLFQFYSIYYYHANYYSDY
jgi:hypothetical protein